AHAAGIVHRDVKPSNLFVTTRPDGSELVKILDFGISKTSSAGEKEPDPQLTGDGEVLGSPSYMSPEQVRNSHTVDARADIWALGVTLIEMCTGLKPFQRTTFAATCAAIVTDPIPDIRAACQDVPEGLVSVITRCLEKEPSSRFEDVAKLAAALVPFGSDEARAHALRTERSLRALRGTSDPAIRLEPSSSSANLIETKVDASLINTSHDFQKSIRPPRTRKPLVTGVILAVVCVAAFVYLK